MSLKKRRALPARRPNARRKFLQLERLEERSVLAGNVNILASGGYVNILGDGGDNQLTITLNGTNGAIISGQGGTTLNRGSASVTVDNFASFLNVNLGGGNDSLTLNGSTTQQLRVSGASLINLGEGNDTLKLNNFSSALGLIVYGGGGNDTVEGAKIADSTVNGGLRVNGPVVLSLGAGNDVLNLKNSAFNKTFLADGGLGNDTLDFRNNEFRSVTVITGSLGTDSFNNTGNTYTIPPFASGVETTTTSQGPTAVNDTATVAESGNVAINVLTNDTAPGSTINATTVTIATPPTRGTVAVNPTTGVITYTNNGSEFAADSFTYTVRDASGVLSAPATVNITITPVNDLPVANPETFTVNEGSSTVFNLGQNDTDAENRLNLGSILITQPPEHGTVTVGSGGNVTYVANIGEATLDTFKYTIADLDGGTSVAATVTINLTQVAGSPPTISAIADQTVDEDHATAVIPFTVNDAETAAAALTVTATSNNTTLVPNANITLAGSGSERTILVTPAANLSGTATITVVVMDGDEQLATETFVVTVNAVNDAPSITGVTDVTTNEDTVSAPMNFTVGDDVTAVNALTVTASSSNPAIVADNGISIVTDGANRQVLITPVGNAFGTSTITLTVSDGELATQQTFIVTVTSINDLPTLQAIGDISEEVGTAFNPIPLSFSDVETSNANLTFTATSDNESLIDGNGLVFTGQGTDTVKLQLNPLATATGTANITVRVTDADGGFAEQVFTVTVDSPPTISAIADKTITEGDSTGALFFTVGDGETAAIDLTLSADSSNTTLVPVANISLGGSGVNRAVTVSPVAGLTGQSTITVTVHDASGLTATESFIVTVAPNALPTISAIDDINASEDQPILPFFITIGDAETSANNLQISATSDNNALIPSNNVVITGTGTERTVALTQIANANGTANITIRVQDSHGGVTTETFAVIITPVNDAPVAGAAAANVLEGGNVVINLGNVSSDIEGALNLASGITITTPPLNGNVIFNNVNGDGTVTYIHSGSNTNSDSFQYTIADMSGNVSAPATVTITVIPVNDAPDAVDDTNTAIFVIGSVTPSTIIGNLLDNDTDGDTAHANLIVSALQTGVVGQVNHLTYGDLVIQQDGSYSYTIDPALVDEFLIEQDLVETLFSYTLTDGELTDVAKLTLNVHIRNSAGG